MWDGCVWSRGELQYYIIYYTLYVQSDEEEEEEEGWRSCCSLLALPLSVAPPALLH